MTRSKKTTEELLGEQIPAEETPVLDEKMPQDDVEETVKEKKRSTKKQTDSAPQIEHVVSESSLPLDLAKKIAVAKIPREGSFEHFTADPDTGLSREQVNVRFSQYLFNESGKKYSKSYLAIILGNLCTYFNLLALLVALALIYAHAPISQFAFALIFTINIFVGIIQECNAKKQIDKLTLVTAPTSLVIRDGQKKKIPSKEVVVDDIILLSLGQQIPADCVMIDGTTEVNESLLTGESVPVKKQEGDVLYAGSFIVGGNCRARVKTVGRSTYASQLTAKAKSYKRPKSEIMNATNLFITIISVLMIPIVLGIIWINMPSGVEEVPETIQKVCAVIIGMIPSGMILLSSIAMSTGILRLSQSHTLVNDMYSLEMLARVDVLCLDKTGTITDGRMKVESVTLLNSFTQYSVEEVMSSMLIALNDNNQTSIALKERFVTPNGDLEVKNVVPFNSKRKFSAVYFAGTGTFVYGAPEFVLRPMSPRVEKMVREFSQRGLRVLVLAYSSGAMTGEKLPSIVRPMALIALSDNIRADAPDTIRWFRENNVDVKVISGDNPVTVSEVARRAGVGGAEKYISLEGLSDREVEEAVDSYSVFGRVTPEQKAILVKALKKNGHTVAMTGDGVNDILAMKEADCAISVASGSEAARNVSNLVLTDNNFANLPKVVHEGRRVINNVKSTSSLYIMKTLFTAFLAIICISIGIQYLFTTNNLLCFELIVAGIPSILYSQQPNKERLKGKFFPYVLCHALPAAMTMVLSVMAIYVGSMFQFGEFTSTYRALAVFALTFSGVIMLFRISQPLTPYRAITVIASFLVCIAIFSFNLTANIVVDGWSDIEFNLTGMLFVIVVLESCFAVSDWLMKLFGSIEKGINSEPKEQSAETAVTAE